jgi:hypothetical protein
MATTDGNDLEKPRIVEPPGGYAAEGGPDLRPETVEEFLEWAGGVPTGGTEVVRERIASARDDSSVLERLVEELWRLPVRDDTRHLLLLSTIGELRDGRAADELARFIWFPDERIAALEHEVADGCGFGPSTADVLKARAVEMLAYLGTSQAVEESLRVAADHPTPSVRAAAIDAHLYNHDDSQQEMDRLRGRVRSSDAALVGLPRFTRDANPEAFDRAITELYDRYPDRRPPLERNAGGPALPREQG